MKDMSTETTQMSAPRDGKIKTKEVAQVVNIYRKASELAKAWQDSYCSTADGGGKVEQAIIGLLEPLLEIENATMDCCEAVAEQSTIDTEGDAQVLVDVGLLQQIRDIAADAAAGITDDDKFHYAKERCETIEKLISGVALPAEAAG